LSQFLPEGGSGAPPPGQTSLTPANPNVTQEDVALMQRVLRAAAQNPNLIPDEFMAYMVDYVQTAGLVIPIGQVFGFSGYTVQSSDYIAAFESTPSLTYTDIGTVGPTLAGLPDGNYLVLVCADIDNSAAGQESHMSISINGVAATDTDSAQCREANFVSCTRPSLHRLANGGANTLVAKYRTSAGSAFFGNRQIFALKYSNL